MSGYDQYQRAGNSQQSAAATGPGAVIQGHGLDAAGAATKYLTAINTNHAAAAVKLFLCPRAGTLKNLICNTETVPGGSDTSIFTVQTSTDKGATWTDSALTATVAAAGAQASDTTHQVAVAAGTLVAMKHVSSGTLAAKVTCACEFV